MEYLSLLGILIGLAIVVYGSFRSISLLILAPIATVVVALTSGLNPITAYGTEYMIGVGSAVTTFLPYFLAGALFGKLLEDSGVAESLAIAVVEKIGTKHIVTAVGVATMIMVIGGVNTFVIIFTMFPLAVNFFRGAGIPRKMIPGCILGPAVVAQLLPGTTQLQNVIPPQYLGGDAMNAPITAILSFILVGCLTFWYLNKEAKKCIAAGVPFDDESADDPVEVNMDRSQLPHPLLALIPIGTVLVLLNVFKIEPYACLFAGCAILLVMFFKRYKNLAETVNNACTHSRGVITTAAIVGFGSVVKLVPGFTLVQDFLTSVTFGNPLIYGLLGVSILCALLGSSTGGMMIALEALSERMLAMGGVAPASIARVIGIASLGLDSLPHNSAIVLTLDFCGVSHKDGYVYLLYTTVIFPMLGAIMAVITGMLGII